MKTYKITCSKDLEQFKFEHGYRINGNAEFSCSVELKKGGLTVDGDLLVEGYFEVVGEGKGLHGQSYAFPTLDKNMKKISMDELKKHVDNLIKCANQNTTKIFLLTKVGCGIAGYEERDIKEIFNRNDMPANIVVPEGWMYVR